MALESVNFKTTEEIVKEHDTALAGTATPKNLYSNDYKSDIFTQMPLETQMAFNPEQPYFQPFNKPDLRKSPEQEHGFFATTGHAFSENNELFEGARAVSTLAEHVNAVSDPIPEDWSAYTKESLEGIDQKYWGYVTDAISPKEQDARRQFILNKQTENESYNNGSYLAKLIGGGAGYLAGPSTLLLPISATIKYANVGQNIIMNTLRQSPQLALQSVAHNAFMEGTKVGGNLQDFAVNSLMDATAGIALTGGAAGFGSAVSGGKLFNARKSLKLNHEGIDVHFNVDEDGIVDKDNPYTAVPLPNESLNAMQVNTAQEFLNSTAAKEGLFKLIPGATKAAGIISPVWRMLNSDFLTSSEFANRLFDHSIITKGLAAGKAAKNNFERATWALFSKTKAFTWQLEGLRNEANGIEVAASEEMAKKGISQRMDKGPGFDKEQFGEAVASVIRTGNQHSNKSINEAANLTMKHLEGTYKAFLKAYGLSEEVLPPRTAINYLMRNYNTDMLIAKAPEWHSVISSALKEQDELITSLQEPLNEATMRLNQLKEYKLTGTKEDRAIVNEIEEAKGRVTYERDQLQTQLADDPNLHILLQERNFLSTKQRQELKSLLSPIDAFEKTVSKQRALVRSGKSEVARSKSNAIKGKKNETKVRNVERLEKTNEQLSKEQAKLDDLENQLLDMRAELNERAINGEINSRFYTRDSDTGFIKFRDPDELPKFRDVYENDESRIAAAESYRETILNRTPEQLGRQMLGTLSGGNLENPLTSRSLMVPDEVLQNAGFLSNDLGRNIATYDSILGKKTAFKNTFNQFGTEDGVGGITKELTRELTRKERLINKLPKEAQEQSRKKLNKQFTKAKEDIATAYQHAMGLSHSGSIAGRKFRKFSKGIRDFSVATRLGGVPLTMITDIGGVFLNNSFIEVARDGLIPFFKTFNGLIKSAEGEAYRENASHLGIAMEHQGNAYADKFWNSSTQSEVTPGGRLANALDWTAQKSGNVFGTNYMDNALQRIAANVTQSKIMNYMFRFKEGRLTDKQRIVLNKMGIAPEEWADRFISSFKEHNGEVSGTGGYYSYYYDWTDTGSKLKMGDAIRSGVRASVLKKGLGDAPFWTNDPVWGLITHFKGWLFSAFTRYTIPTMQRLDAEKALGMGVMIMMGSLVDPLRKWSRGEEYDFSDKSKFALDAINNSGVFGILTDVVQDANVLLHGELLGRMKNDRYRDRSIGGMFAGPLGAIADDFSNVLASFASGKINQQDMNKFIRLIPFTQASYLRYLSNKLVEAMDLPQNRNHAEGWTSND